MKNDSQGNVWVKKNKAKPQKKTQQKYNNSRKPANQKTLKKQPTRNHNTPLTKRRKKKEACIPIATLPLQVIQVINVMA